MEKYNYLENVKADVLAYLNENYADQEGTIDREELAEQLNDDLWVDDSVTGNASGSYTCNAWQAEENLCHNTDLLLEALEEFGADTDSYMRALKSAEYADVTIRCYLPGQAIELALDEWLNA
jgi:hypothetical protein